MSDTEWGAPIKVEGDCPSWLDESEKIFYLFSDLTINENWVGPTSIKTWQTNRSFRLIGHIKLPATHPAYLAIAKGFEPWAGGDSAPGNWDQGDVLLRDGDTCEAQEITSWTNDGQFDDIIGYKKRQPEDVSDDTVMVKRMTEAEWRQWAKDLFLAAGPDAQVCNYVYAVVKALGLAIEPTQAETIAQKTGLTVDQVQSVLNEVSNGTR